MALKNNTWKLNQWYDQDVAGNVSYSGAIELWGWGANENGAFGLNNRTNYSSPIQIPGTTWNFPPSGNTHTAATSLFTKTDGTLWSWGYNYNGLLGQNESYPSPRHARSSPVQLPGTTWDYVAVGRANALALKTDGTLWTWGSNDYGVFGTNSDHATKYSSPVQVPGDWSSAKIYNSNMCVSAIKSDGTLWAWGYNSYGNLGQNNQVSYSSPVQVSGTNWARCSSGSPYAMLATRTDGTLWAWGANSRTVLGQNEAEPASYSSPVQIPGTTWDYTSDYKIALGDYVSCAIKTDGTFWSWGYNNFGALGNNDRAWRSSPVQIPGTNWNTVSNSYGRYTTATKTDGTLWNWGAAGTWMGGAYYSDNPSQSAQYSSPVQVPGTWGNVLATRRNVFIQKVL